MTPVLHLQRMVFFVAAFACLALELSNFRIPSSLLVATLAILVVFLGLPHGSLDPLVAWKAGMWRDVRGLFVFLALYLVLAGASIVLWISFPLVALILFLGYSAWHFAGDWRASLPLVPRLAAGLVIVSGPALFHAELVASYFTILTQNAAGSMAFVRVLSLVSIPAAVLVFGTALRLVQRNPAFAGELAVLVTCALLLPPLVFFILYFCGLHSPRHLMETVKGLNKTAVISVGVGVTFLTVVGGWGVLVMLPSASLDERLLQIIFIGLAALTVPHMLLIEQAARPGEEKT